jgi:D-sedoheptulose 7-phosphate isomerase
LITAIANDLCYDDVFSEPLKWKMTTGDMLVAISSSGRSRNVLSACEVALSLGGYLVNLSAMKPDNPMRSLGHLNFYVPAEDYGTAETCHAGILHYWMDQIHSEISLYRENHPLQVAV